MTLPMTDDPNARGGVRCPDCGGDGRVLRPGDYEGPRSETCGRCEGSGMIAQRDPGPAAPLLLHGERQVLPHRRTSLTINAVHRWPPGGPNRPDEHFMLAYSWNTVTWKIAEVFLEIEDRRNVPLARLYQDIATTISIALQYGAPLETLEAATGKGEVNVMGKVQVSRHSPLGTVLAVLLEAQRELDQQMHEAIKRLP